MVLGGATWSSTVAAIRTGAARSPAAHPPERSMPPSRPSSSPSPMDERPTGPGAETTRTRATPICAAEARCDWSMAAESAAPPTERDAGSEAIHIFRTELILDNTGTQNLGRPRQRPGRQSSLRETSRCWATTQRRQQRNAGCDQRRRPPVPPEENGVTHPPRAATLKVVKGAGGTATLTIASLTRTTAAGASLDFAGDGEVIITAAPMLPTASSAAGPPRAPNGRP